MFEAEAASASFVGTLNRGAGHGAVVDVPRQENCCAAPAKNALLDWYAVLNLFQLQSGDKFRREEIVRCLGDWLAAALGWEFRLGQRFAAQFLQTGLAKFV